VIEAECGRKLWEAFPAVNTGSADGRPPARLALRRGDAYTTGIRFMEAKMREKINDDLKTAMKAGDKDRVGTLRLVNAAIKSADIDARPSGKDKISDSDILSVLTKMVKQRRDSIEQFTAGGRPELAEKEQAEINIIEAYLPQQMSEDEAKAAIAAAIKETAAAGPKDMGKVMAALKAKYAGQMDFGKASGLTKELLK
jgi:uncharacterized protein